MITASNITKSVLRDEAIIGTVLSNLHNATEAKKIAKIASDTNPLVSFGKKTSEGVVYGQTIADDFLKHVRIKTNAGKEPYRYFRRIHATDAPQKYGFNASAWVETNAQDAIKKLENGKCDLRFGYPGFTNASQITAMLGTFNGQFHQVHEVAGFAKKAMDAAKTMEIPVGGVINTSWSMGAANALASNLYFKHQGIQATAILGDAWKSSDAVEAILKNAEILRSVLGGSHADRFRYSEPTLREMLTKDVISLYPATKNQQGAWTRSSLSAPAEPGEFPIAEQLGILPFGNTVGRVFHIDAKDMQTLEPVKFLGDTHHRANIAYHLYTKDADILHEIPQVTAEKYVNRSMR